MELIDFGESVLQNLYGDHERNREYYILLQNDFKALIRGRLFGVRGNYYTRMDDM